MSRILRKSMCAGVVLAVAGCLTMTGIARAGDLPSADKVLGDYIKATGGAKAYEKHKTSFSEATMEIKPMGIKMNMKHWSSAPALQYVEVNVEGMGTTVECVDGKNAWSVSPMQGDSIAEGEELDFKLRSAIFNSELKWKEIYKKVECVGKEEINGKECYKVVKTPPTGNPSTEYYDAESKLLVKQSMIVTSPMGDVPVESFVSDYREVDGVLVPFKITATVMGTERVVDVKKQEFNVEISKDKFAMPDQIKELMAKNKSGSGEKDGK